MKTAGLVLWGSLSALALTLSADGCGGRAVLDVPRAGGAGDGGDDSGSSGSSSGISGSGSGIAGSSSGLSGSSSGSDGGSSGSSSGIDGGSSGSSSGFSGGSSGSSSGFSGGSSGSSSGGPPGPRSGSIYLEECQAPLCQGQQFQAFADFYSTGPIPSCPPVTTVGSCAYYASCTQPTQNEDSAGTLTITGPWLVPPVTITPMSGTNAYQYSSSSPGFTAGQTLAVSASGATVPAFGPVSVVAPQLTTLVQPPVATDGGAGTVIDTSSDLVVAWTGGQAGSTMVFEALGGANYAFCTWNGSDGKDVVPAAVLKPLAGTGGYLFYGQYDATTFSAGPYAVTLTALPYAGGTASFQ